jgi:hypothetical protein
MMAGPYRAGQGAGLADDMRDWLKWAKGEPERLHDPGEAQGRAAVRARRFIGFSAVVAVTLPPASR